MTQKDKNTEQKILDAASQVFHTHGYDGARMQEIASEAGINKGLLHYYFKTKDALFQAIFGVALNQIIAKILIILEKELSVEDKINQLVDQYISMLLLNPNLPRFVLHELSKNPDHFTARHLNKKVEAAFMQFSHSIEAEVAQGKIRAIDARQLFTNLMSLMVFPFVGKPMLQKLFQLNNLEYKKLMEARKAHVKDFIQAALRP